VIQDIWGPPDRGHYIQRNGVNWNETYDGSGYPVTCKAAEYTDYCLPGSLVVRNENATPIVCHGEIRMPTGNKLGLTGATRDMIIMELTSAVLVKTMASVNIRAESYTSDCKPWQPPPPPAAAAGCAFRPKDGAIALTHPPGAKERDEAGPVVLHFTLAKESGRPEKIEVAASSLFPELDADAVRTLGATEMTTECPGARFSVVVSYRPGPERLPTSGPPFNTSPSSGQPCKPQMRRPANPDAFYPKGSLERGEEGDVLIRAFPAEKTGPPVDAVIEGSSGFPELDAAGLLTARNTWFSANCPDLSLRFKVRFRRPGPPTANPASTPGQDPGGAVSGR